MNQDFYRSFEDRHRGSRETIQERQRVYLNFLRPLAQMASPPRLADLGCGRGEWLELLRAKGWQAQGVDIDEAMLAACRERGLDVRKEDALRFLQGLPDASLWAISAFQVAEHLPFQELGLVLREALRVLHPGGLLILETPNPENLVVGSSSFYLDPTHERPLPPALLAFLIEYTGFGRFATLRLNEGFKPGRPVELIDVLAGVSPDYAVVAQKGGLAGASPDAVAALDAAFAQGRGFNLNGMAERYDRQLSNRFRELHTATEMAREASAQLQRDYNLLAGKFEALERWSAATLATAAGLQRHAIDQMFEANAQNVALQREVSDLRASTSWRITAPMRWIGAIPSLLRRPATAGNVRRALGRSARSVADAVARGLRDHPKARATVVRLATRLGLDSIVPRKPAVPPPPPVPPQEPASLPANAQRVHQSLKSALARRAGNKEEQLADHH